jgi:hypothetical protein
MKPPTNNWNQMIIVVIVLFVAILATLWIIFVPVNIRVDTKQDLYEVSQPGTLSVSFHPHESSAVRIRVLGYALDPRSRQKRKGVDKKLPKPNSSRRMRSFSAWKHLFRGVIKSFRCRRFNCRVDFEDVVLNAQLSPIAYYASRGSVMLDINFRKEYHLDVWIQVRVYRMLWTFVRFSLTK